MSEMQSLRESQEEDNGVNERSVAIEMNVIIGNNSSQESTDRQPINETATDGQRVGSESGGAGTSGLSGNSCPPGGQPMNGPEIVVHPLSNSESVSAPPERVITFTNWSAFFIIYSMIMYSVDIILDIMLAISHYVDHNYWYFGLTLAFISIPSLITTATVIRIHATAPDSRLSPVFSRQTTREIVLVVSQMQPIISGMKALDLGFSIRRSIANPLSQILNYGRLLLETEVMCRLSLTEAFQESAPQQVLQLYILAMATTYGYTAIIQVVGVFAALLSMSWSLVAYHKAFDLNSETTYNVDPGNTWPAFIVQMVSYMFAIAARLLAITLFATQFTYILGVVLVIHVMIMFIIDHECPEGFNTVSWRNLNTHYFILVVNIFCYPWRPIRNCQYHYIGYNVVIFVENLILLTFWYNYCDDSVSYKAIAVYLNIGIYLVGFYFTFVHYVWSQTLNFDGYDNINTVVDETTGNSTANTGSQSVP